MGYGGANINLGSEAIIKGGSSSSSGAAGGVTISGGDSSSSGNGGSVTIKAGASQSGTKGDIIMKDGNGANRMIIDELQVQISAVSLDVDSTTTVDITGTTGVTIDSSNDAPVNIISGYG